MSKEVIENHVNLLRNEAKILLEMLEKPEYGLAAWHLMVTRQIEKIASFQIIKGLNEK